MPTIDEILSALSTVADPELHKDIVTLGMVKDIAECDGIVRFRFTLTTPACPMRDRLETAARQVVAALPGVTEVNIVMDAIVSADKRLGQIADLKIRNAIAVASGKGGVGKSTVAVNLAVALSRTGAKVGLLDADIYGPNVPLMVGLAGRKPTPLDGKMMPLQAFGVEVISMGFIAEAKQAIIWRGPMLQKALHQFLNGVRWGELDYLLVDLPPGTGDVHISLCQMLPLTGAVIVTTPQEVALADVVKGIAMFERMEVPILGIIENMSGFYCPNCDERIDIFGHGGGERTAKEFDVPFLGEIPLESGVRIGGDAGIPIVVRAPESRAGKALQSIAADLAARISVMHHLAQSGVINSLTQPQMEIV
ncbi:MAG: iron-sulfur cluster carrier protein ApbC [Chloroflexi bacterium]|nr:iron-sulfur cluster carrier protein ApbC [Chloroflexota bacterium]